MSTLQVSNIIGQPAANLGAVSALTANVSGNVIVSGTISDSVGDIRIIPQNTQSAAYVIQASDNGKFIKTSSGGVTINSGVFTTGQSVTIYNNSSGNQTITQGAGVTMYLVGTATTGNRTMAQRALVTILCVDGSTSTYVITGGGLT